MKKKKETHTRWFKQIPMLFVLVNLSVIVFAILFPVLSTNNRAKQTDLDTLSSKFKSYKRQAEFIVDADYNKYVSIETKHQQFVNEINRQNNRMELLMWLFGGVSVITIIFGGVEYYRKFDGRVKLAVQEKTEDMLIQIEEKNKKSLKTILRQTDLELIAKDKLELIIFFQKTDGVDNEIKKRKEYFEKMGFNIDENNFIKISKLEEVNEFLDGDSKIIFFDDNLKSKKITKENKPRTVLLNINKPTEIVIKDKDKIIIEKQSISLELIDDKTSYEWINKINNWFLNGIKDKKLEENAKKIAFFYFGKGHLFAVNFDASYANSIYSLYHNLIDLMRYKYVMDKEK